jgi:hypothetical protein
MREGADNLVSVKASLARQVKPERILFGRPEPKPGCRSLLDHHDDAGAGGSVNVETEVMK